jgi:4-alpha-glucanotransferase
MRGRGSGILLHVTSLPSPFGIGDFGPAAYRFAEFLAAASQRYWQILPLSPPSDGYSPYHARSAFALNPLLISPDLLSGEGLLDRADLKELPRFPVHFELSAVSPLKTRLLQKAFERFLNEGGPCRPDYLRYCSENSGWLDDYALFSAVQTLKPGRDWSTWPGPLRNRSPDALEQWKDRNGRLVEYVKFLQFILEAQWKRLRNFCNRLGILIVGDAPYYVGYDSADVWSHPGLFKLDRRKKPAFQAGVPPDYFSATGQLWGNPVYDWARLRETRFAWWMDRLARNFSLYDLLRIDHFRGLVAYWEVPAGERTAVRGRWVECPVRDFFREARRRNPLPPLIAEDLGLITPDVREVIRELEIPGMRVLLFAFGEDMAASPHIPHNYVRKTVAYTGTHDNNTVRGWFRREAGPRERHRLFGYLGGKPSPGELHWVMIRLLMNSIADTAIVPMQDILGLGEEARMNRPATAAGNWRWRLRPDYFQTPLVRRLAEMTKLSGRA